jgi:hypothetical protein
MDNFNLKKYLVENKLRNEEINKENDFSDIDTDMGKDKEAFMDSVEGIVESLYNQGGYRDISFIKEYLKHLIDIS